MNKTNKAYRAYKKIGFIFFGLIAAVVLFFLLFGGGSGLIGKVEEAEVGIRGGIVKLKAIDKENLGRKVEVLENKIALLEKENEALRKQLEAPLPPDLGLLPAKVIGKSRFLFIDKGEMDNIKIGQGVISEDVFIGQIYKVGKRSAKVLLLDDPESKIPVTTNRGAMGLLEENNGRLEISKVLQKDELEKGDFVSTSGGEKIPSGILVGKIGKIIGKKAQVYKSAVVEGAIDYRELLYVFVVKQET